MNCEEAIDVLRSGPASPPDRHASAREHLASCADCRLASFAAAALATERAVAAPKPSPGSFDRALRRAVQRPAASAARRRGFWLGTAVGAAFAAGVAAVAVTLWLQSGVPRPSANPGVTLALNEAHDVSVAIDSPEVLAGAEIRVVLTGAIALQGFDDQRELRWMTDLDRGVNQLTLPLVARGASGGQVTVEVQHGDKLRTFVLEIRTEPKLVPAV